MLFRAATFISALSVANAAFTFSFGDTSECGDLDITWNGGTAPFTLELIPAFGTSRHISVPSSAFSNGKGSFQTTLPLKKTQKFLMSMSDASGFASAGLSEVLVVADPKSGASACNTTDPGPAFSYELNTALQQCRPYTFSGYSTAVQPITITGMIPGGSVFKLHPSKGVTSYDWTANVAAGSPIIFNVVDAQNREGGDSDLLQIGNSDETSCLNSNSPTTTSNAPAAASQTSAAPAATTVASGPTISIGAIAGTAVGGLIALAVLVTLGLFFLRKRRNGGAGGIETNSEWRRSRRVNSVNLLYDPNQTPRISNSNGYHPADTSSATAPIDPPPEFMESNHYAPSPFILPQMNQEIEAFPLRTPTSSDGSRPSMAMSPAARRKASLAGRRDSHVMPSRLVVHTDAEEVVEELPPQYTDRRTTSIEDQSLSAMSFGETSSTNLLPSPGLQSSFPSSSSSSRPPR
ncbi:hypothetical protein PLICRDRAFT_694980 [Plicaturopsis crispa FD-325 SS-3]|nr:hypothetical protein PLICRDRAFT_694980 [Plicaturopsis crispa FD-325 SS-3]